MIDRPDERATSEPATYEIAPTRIGRGSRRSAWWLRIGAIGVAVGIAAAVLGPRDDGRAFLDLSGLIPGPVATPGGSQPPPDGSPTPAPRPDRSPRPTAFPAVAYGEGRRPEQPFHVLRNGLLMIGPASSDAVGAGFEGAYRVVFTDPGGGLVCLCIEAPWSGRSAGFTMRVERHDPVSGATERGVAVLELEDGPSVQAIVQPLQLDVDLAPDGRHLFLASVALESAWWIVRLHVLDASDGTPAGAIVLGAVEGLPDLPGPGSLPRSSPAPPAAASPVWADGPLTLTVPVVQVAPDGGSVRVVAEGLQLEDGPFEGSIPWQRFSWRVGLGPDGRLGEVEALPDERRVGEDFCWREGFGGSDRYFRICQTLDGPRASVFVERANGERTRAIPLTQVEAQAIASALVDPTRGWLYLWSPVDHGLSRIDLETGERRTLELDPDGPLLGDPIAGTDPGEARRPSGDPDPWRRPARALDPTAPTLVGSPDGARLYAAGGSIVDPFGAGSIGPLDQASTGIWVIDAERLTLLGRWLPETAIGSIGLTPDGRYLLGLGVPGIDRAGDRTSWGTTLTAIDTVSGGLAARYAAIPDGIQVIDPAR